MPQPTTLSYVADLVIRRTIAEHHYSSDAQLAQAINDAYPFDETVVARKIWLDALIRYSIKLDEQATQAAA